LEEPPLKARCWDAPSKEHTAAAVKVSSLCAQKSPGRQPTTGATVPTTFSSGLQVAVQCMRAMQQAQSTRESNVTVTSAIRSSEWPAPDIGHAPRGSKSAARKCLAGRTVLSLLRGLLFPASPAARVTITTPIEGPRTVDPWKGEQRNNREAGPILACVRAPRAVQEHCAGSRSYHGRKVSGYRQSSVVRLSFVGIGSHHQ
jgi:hypothetical protein